MRLTTTAFALIILTTAAACRGNQVQPSSRAVSAAGRSVFTDSALHVQQCEPVAPGENWRLVCVPKDQGVPGPRPKHP